MSRPPVPPRLLRLRERIDELDAELIRILSARFELVEELGGWKSRHRIPVEDGEREACLSRLHGRAAREQGLDGGLVQRIFAIILEHSRRRQESSREERSA